MVLGVGDADVVGAGAVNVEGMKVKDLRRELLERGLSVSGRKADLQKRLREYLAEASDAGDVRAEAAAEEEAAAVNTVPEGRSDVACDEGVTLQETQPKPTAAEAKLGETKKEDWRVQAEERRKAALAIRARKKMKLETEAEKPPLVTPVSIPGSASKTMPFNPYAKKSLPVSNPYGSPNKPSNHYAKSAAAATVSLTPATPQSPANPYTKKASASPAPKYGPPKSAEQLPAVVSAWGDCRLDLWEALCTCGGERMAPDVRMCRCPAALDAGLGCECNAGVLLMKDGPRGVFWGCSTYKKKGCKFTKRFGPPHDAQAARQLAEIKLRSMRKAKKEREEWARIADPFEQEWRSVCRCDGAKHLNTFECFMRSEGGCGMMALCPADCGGQLFLHRSKYGTGRWWGCSNYKNGLCKFRQNYVEHK